MELADTSAWTNRHKDARVHADFDARVLSGEIAICRMVEMELLWTARTAIEFAELREELEALPEVVISPEAWARAIDVWNELTRRGQHRQVKQPDLLIAAVTRQPARAIAPLGTL